MRIGFFGGTFDPPHAGHLTVARAAQREFALDKVLLAPTGVQPLKPGRAEAPFADRLAMAALLCEGEPGLEASGIDAPLGDDKKPNFTVETLAKLRGQFSSDDSLKLFVIVGADAFAGLRLWREPDRLLDEYEWIVVSRPGIELNNYGPLQLSPLQRSHVHGLEGVSVPVSATEVRARLRGGLDTGGLLCPAVLEYIQKHGLYGS